MGPCLRRLAAAVLAGCLLAGAAPQGGYTSERHDTHGVRFSRPRSYVEIPTTPSESWVVLKYVEAKERSERAGRSVAPEMWVVRIDWEADPAPVTGGGGDPGESGGDKGGEGGAQDAEKPAAPPPRPPINTFERYLEQKLRGWSATEVSKGRERSGWQATEYLLEPPASSRDKRAGWAFVWLKERERTFAVLGFCAADDREAESKVWRTSASSMRFSEPVSAEALRERQKWERFYSRRNHVDPEYRIGVRLALAQGWQAEDTENYIVIYSTSDQPLVRKVLRDLELIRKEYERLFPPAGPIEAVSTVRICKDADEYHKFGGPPRTAGYWIERDEELVLYDATKREKGKPTDKSDTFIVLYHEAFHQYIHYSAGEVAPHSWYNEGTGDYFSGAVIQGGKVRRIGTNPWRLETIRRAVEQNRSVPWKRIIRMEQQEFYNPATIGICYAQGWSMIYFLNTSREVAAHPRWSRILAEYFEELKRAWAEELDALGANAGDAARYREAQVKARTRAVEAAFEGIDLDEIEAAWKVFVLDL